MRAFDELVGADPAQAIELYRDDFLADFYLPDSETFETWVAVRRAEYRRQVLTALETITAVHLQRGTFDRAEKLARRQLAIDNLRESSHRQLLEALARIGKRQEALAHYKSLRHLLQNELAIEPCGKPFPSSKRSALVIWLVPNLCQPSSLFNRMVNLGAPDTTCHDF